MTRRHLLLLGSLVLLVALAATAYGVRSWLCPGSPYSSARGVADALGCTGYSSGLPAPALGISVTGVDPLPEFATCTYRGGQTVVAWSTSRDAPYQLLDLARTHRPPGRMLHGPGWAVECASSRDCLDIHDRIGGVLG